MTELEKMQRAKMYIDKMANGINPIDDTTASENEVINNVRISRCLFYVSDILRQVIENGGVVKAIKSAPKYSFFLTDEQKEQYIPSEKPLTVSEIVNALNAIADLEKCKKISHLHITAWLISIGALELRADIDGKAKKFSTAQGVELGITNEIRNGRYGEFNVVVYNKDAQQLIVDNIESIMALKSESSENTLKNQGQPWTIEQDESLIKMFNENVPVSEMAIALMRTKSGIRARLKRLGLIEK